MDIVAPANTPIYAVGDGKVITNTFGSEGGNYLVIAHTDGTYSYYGHMTNLSPFSVGTQVKAGDTVGYVGKTGTATGYHLHFEWSGHDPYCEFAAQGYVAISPNSGASKYPHSHEVSAPATPATSVTATTMGADPIMQTSAVLHGRVTSSGIGLIECGMHLGESPNNMTLFAYEFINADSASCDYDTEKCGRPLAPGTTYYYQVYAKASDYTITWGEIRSFTTASSVTAATLSADPITQTSAVLHGQVTSSGIGLIECGMHLGEAPDSMTLFAYEFINANSADCRYDTEDCGKMLTPGTTYYYQVYAKASDYTITWGEIKSFTTLASILPDPPTIVPLPAYQISLDRSALSLKVGEGAAISATASPSSAAVEWSSNDAVVIVVNGRVDAVGVGHATITATVGDKTASCTVTVTTAQTMPTITTQTIPSGKVGESYQVILSAGGSAPIKWSVSAGLLPEGLTLYEATGTISGVPQGSGSFNFVIAAENEAGEAKKEFSLTIKDEKKTLAGRDVHFEHITVYFQDQFSDVPANQWYTENVEDAFEFGLMKGDSATTFNPYGYVTIAEAVTMASRIHSIYTTGTENFIQSSGKWYQVYLDYARANGIIGKDYYNCDATQKATRAQFAEIFANSLPDEALSQINTVADNAIPDVKMSASYAEFVYELYRAGILTGSDANGTFSPQTYITRAETAAIVSRMAESNNRVVFSMM
ncbi:MAG: peptidoglycan DD-metalloendopeptidase family protein [Oscillospiraceae bacterium]|nr:peptidoglycan DD-metalloendopeptidase family protein [Oscillospiraceae bacterium]